MSNKPNHDSVKEKIVKSSQYNIQVISNGIRDLFHARILTNSFSSNLSNQHVVYFRFGKRFPILPTMSFDYLLIPVLARFRPRCISTQPSAQTVNLVKLLCFSCSQRHRACHNVDCLPIVCILHCVAKLTCVQ